MADQKVTELTNLTTAASEDVFYIVDDPSGTPVSKKITAKNLFGSVPANTTFTHFATFNNKVTAANGVVTLASSTTVGSNNATNVLGAGMQGSTCLVLVCKEVYSGMKITCTLRCQIRRLRE